MSHVELLIYVETPLFGWGYAHRSGAGGHTTFVLLGTDVVAVQRVTGRATLDVSHLSEVVFVVISTDYVLAETKRRVF